MPQLRQNPITGDWVVIAPERAKRPSDFIQTVEATNPSARHSPCPFCVGGAAHAERLLDTDRTLTYVTPSKYPAFIANPADASARSGTGGQQFYRARPAVGGNDIIVIKDPNVGLLTFSNATWTELLEQFGQRMCSYAQQPGVQTALPIYNHRSAAGASQRHPHAQLFATDIVPNFLSRELHGGFKAFEQSGRCVFCELIVNEQRFRTRIVAENDTFVAFTFYAARFPFEVWVLPKSHHDRFETADPTTISYLAELLSHLFDRYNQTLKNPPLNFWIHSLPNSLDRAEYFHWHLEIAPRLATYGGFELGSGVIIDVVSPERAAEFLR